MHMSKRARGGHVTGPLLVFNEPCKANFLKLMEDSGGAQSKFMQQSVHARVRTEVQTT